MIRIQEVAKFPLKPLGEVAEVLDHLRRPVNSTDRANRVGPYPYYGANGQVGCIDEFLFDEDLVLVAEDGGFFLDELRPISYCISGKAWINNHAHVLRPKDGIDVHWLNFSVAYQDIRHMINGTTRAKLNQRELREILIPVPGRDEQIRIASKIQDCFARVDEIEILQNESEAQARLLFAATINSAVDESWPMRALADICTDIRNGWSGKQDEGGSLVGVLRLSCVHGLEIDITDVRDARLSQKNAKDFAITHDDVFVVRGNGSKRLVGRSALVTQSNVDKVVFNDLLIRLRFKACAHPRFVNYVLHSAKVRQQIESLSKTAAGIWKINQTNLGLVQVPCPDPTLQVSIAARLDEAKETVGDLLSEISQPDAARLRQAVLLKAFSGEL